MHLPTSTTPSIAEAEPGFTPDRADLEAAVAAGFGDERRFEAVGSALRTLRDTSAYAPEYGSFATYCRQRFGKPRSTVYQFIAAADLMATLRTCGLFTEADLPSVEAHCRPLTTDALDEAERIACWHVVCAAVAAGARLTAALVKATVATYLAERDGADEPAPRRQRARAAGGAADLAARLAALSHSELAAVLQPALAGREQRYDEEPEGLRALGAVLVRALVRLAKVAPESWPRSPDIRTEEPPPAVVETYALPAPTVSAIAAGVWQ